MSKNTGSRLREISIEGAPLIGEGAHSKVYRIAEDTIVKVYRPFVSLDEIQKEKELSRWALIKGLPTAISFDIVRVGDNYGVVYELLNAKASVDYIKESEQNFENYVRKSVELMNRIHGIEVTVGELPDMKTKHLRMAQNCSEELSAEQFERLMDLIQKVPDSHTLLHGDYHLNNLMVVDDELMLIDMETLCVGDPIFELATIYNSYCQFPSISEMALTFLGIDDKTAKGLWKGTLDYSLGDVNESVRRDVTNRAQILGCVRIIDYINRRKEAPERELVLTKCFEDLRRLLR